MEKYLYLLLRIAKISQCFLWGEAFLVWKHSTFSYFCFDFIKFVQLDEFYWKSVDSTGQYTWIMLHYSWILNVKWNYVWIMICFIIHEKLTAPREGVQVTRSRFTLSGENVSLGSIIWGKWTLFRNNKIYHPWSLFIFYRIHLIRGRRQKSKQK